MNSNYYETLDENFEQALKMYENDYTNEELIEMLKNGNIVQKQIAALRLDKINSKEEAQVLTQNLTGQDGKIREAVSLKLNEFMSNPKYLKYFENSEIYNIFIDAIIDINANICRNVISAITHLKENPEFCQNFYPKLTELTENLLDKIKMFDFQDGKYKVNKEVFKLYWCLETIYIFYDKMDFSKLKQILLDAKNIQEYTIREKVAKILTHDFTDEELNHAKEELKNDKNYYVRRYFEG